MYGTSLKERDNVGRPEIGRLTREPDRSRRIRPPMRRRVGRLDAAIKQGQTPLLWGREGETTWGKVGLGVVRASWWTRRFGTSGREHGTRRGNLLRPRWRETTIEVLLDALRGGGHCEKYSASGPQDHALHPRLSVKATRPIIHYRTTIYTNPSNTDMGNIQSSLSKMKNKFKQRLTGRKRRPDGTGANPGEGRADTTNPPPQPDPHAIADESHDLEGDGANAAGEQASSTVRPPQPDGPESVPARGNNNRQEGGEADVDGGEASEKDSHPNPVGGGRSGELEAVDPSPSTPSISHGAEPNGTWTWLFWFFVSDCSF